MPLLLARRVSSSFTEVEFGSCKNVAEARYGDVGSIEEEADIVAGVGGGGSNSDRFNVVVFAIKKKLAHATQHPGHVDSKRMHAHEVLRMCMLSSKRARLLYSCGLTFFMYHPHNKRC